MNKTAKPIGRKAYGSIPHLPGSRLGPGDHKVHAGQAAICLRKARDRHDRIIVTEKLDGSNVAVARVDGVIWALGRAGYPASTSPFEHHHLFAHWVREHEERFRAMLHDGECVHGEWLAQAHGTRYELPHEPFVAFDLTRDGARLPWDDITWRCVKASITLPDLLSYGPPLDIDDMLSLISTSTHGAIDPVEGAVWRAERNGKFDFMAKYVRPDKQDGKYLPDIAGCDPIWHWRPCK